MYTPKLNSDGFYYFKLAEFDSPDLPGSGNFMDREFIHKLDSLRAYYNKPILISSGYRTTKHNAKVGGDDDSSHLAGFAADIPIFNSIHRYKILFGALCVGITRLGIYPTHIHLDADPSKANNVIWHRNTPIIH